MIQTVVITIIKDKSHRPETHYTPTDKVKQRINPTKFSHDAVEFACYALKYVDIMGKGKRRRRRRRCGGERGGKRESAIGKDYGREVRNMEEGGGVKSKRTERYKKKKRQTP